MLKVLRKQDFFALTPYNSISLYFLMKTFALVAILASFLVTGCTRCSEEQKVDLVEKKEDVNGHVTMLLKEALEDADSLSIVTAGKDTLLAPGLAAAIYQSKEFAPLWINAGKLTPAGDTLFSIITNAGDYGLIPGDYNAYGIDSLIDTSFDTASRKFDAVKICQADMLLTDAFFVMSVHLGKGRLLPDTALLHWSESKADSNIIAILSEAIEKNMIREALESMEPVHPDYHYLKLALKKLREEFNGSEGWDELPSIEKDTAAFYKLLLPRLIASHDYDSTVTGSDSVKLAAAIKSFQRKHGLEEDGKAGKNTRRLLALSLRDHIRQIEITMERWRLEPERPKRYVWVNIPSYTLRVMEADTLVMRSRVVVGDFKTPTPILASTINYFLLYPYWNVPYSIASKEILPKVQRDTAYLRKNRYEVLDRNGNIIDPNTINWKKYSKNNLPYKFRQREGEDNSLGVMKFNFNNKHGVYLHDTNSKRYFGRDIRALSHGCIRLEKYMDFATYLIREDSVKINRDSLIVYLQERKRKQISVKKPLPILIRYFTCEANAEGEVIFFTDIYRKDREFQKVLYRKENERLKSRSQPVLAKK